MKSLGIIFFTSSGSLPIVLSQYKNLFESFSKKFDIILVNYSSITSKKLKFPEQEISKFPKNINFYDPLNLSSINKILKDLKLKSDKIIFIDNIAKRFENIPLLFYLKRKKIPRIVVSNIGNIQPPPSYNKVNFLSSIKYLIFRTIPKKIISAGSILGFFPKVDIRYYSNKKIYELVNKKINKFSTIKKCELVSSININLLKDNNETSNNLILLIDKDLIYLNEKKKYHINISKDQLKNHYKNNIFILKKIANYYSKDVAVSIHPSYDHYRIQKEYGDIKVYRGQVRELIKKSYIVLFYDSSAIVDAILFKKKIINLRSDFFEFHNFKTDYYNEDLNLIKIATNPSQFDMNLIIDYVNKEVNYENYINKYISHDLEKNGIDTIIKSLEKNFL